MRVVSPPPEATLPGREPRPPTRAWRWRHWLAAQALPPLARFPRPPSASVGVLTYHRIAPAVLTDPYLLNVTPRRLQAQLEGLVARGYRTWPLTRAIEALERGALIPPRTFLLVFDDGYENVYRFAWPLLRRLQLEATIFLPTAYLDSASPLPFETHLPAGSPPESWRVLTTEQCREMLVGGQVEIGSHTHTHGDFRGRPEAFACDVQQSLDVLERCFGIRHPAFAYPFGHWEPAFEPELRELGLSCGFAAHAGFAGGAEHRFHWGRFGVTRFDSAASLAAKLEGWYCCLQRAWAGIRLRKACAAHTNGR